MSRRFQALLIALSLAFMGLIIIWYKVSILGIPFLPHERSSVYTVGAEISFEGQKKAALVSMALPQAQDGIQILSEDVASSGFGYAEAQTENGKRAEWSKRRVSGPQILYYSLEVMIEPGEKNPKPPIAFNEQEKASLSDLPDTLVNTAKILLDDVRLRSADTHSFAAQLIQEFNEKDPSQAAKILLSQGGEAKIDMLYRLLRYRHILARKIYGLYLVSERRNIALTPMLEVYDGKKWQLYDLKKGKVTRDKNFFIWQRGGDSLLDVTGGKKSNISFSITERQVPIQYLLDKNELVEKAAVLDFSLFSLPVSEQNAYRHILLVPFGALVVVLLRILVGLRTSGTFMPILIALAFMETTLFAGLIMFILIVGIGLMIRSYLSSLNLLLVARISAVMIVVIMIMSFMSILSFKLGIKEVLTITFFPMIILAWTIERMSILWEEEGAHEVFIQGGGSLIVAIFAYFVMSDPFVSHMAFNFPELLLVVLAGIILLGRYSGYRMSELIRFRSMVD
ncbi:MAG: inactive transglutaminase family protein [Sulfurovum sp.]|uniref:inactive transglutaminase family protein n=1 Tax=Sulfurovum sp. TaxID=1969726 RepID=UPI0028682812|nr:inactive transglutaminase family protein [Sulfurovum sp.]MCO4844560.1 inactive transglutaminase family protein [Sulfurovum sp.]